MSELATISLTYYGALPSKSNYRKANTQAARAQWARIKATQEDLGMLAPLPPEEQELALTKAAKEDWTVKRAREEVQGVPKNVETITYIVCPECGVQSPMSRVETRTEAV